MKRVDVCVDSPLTVCATENNHNHISIELPESGGGLTASAPWPRESLEVRKIELSAGRREHIGACIFR